MSDTIQTLAQNAPTVNNSTHTIPTSPSKPYLIASDGQRITIDGQQTFASGIPFHDPGRPIYWAEAETIRTKYCRQQHGPYSDAHRGLFAAHERRERKDGRTFFPGQLMDNECHTPSVERIDLIIADVDCAEESEVTRLLERIERSGLGCDIYSTHSSGVSQTEVKYDDYVERCKAWHLDQWSREAAQRYLRDVEKYPEKIVAGAFVKQRCVQLSGLGTAVVFGHAPVIKLRIAFTLDQPYVPCEIVQRGFSDKDARQRVWPAALALLFKALGIPYDASGTALAHRFYSASCRHSADPYVHRIEGSAVRLESILPRSQEELDALLPRAGKAGKSQQQRGSNDDRAPRKFVHQGFDLKAWIAQYGGSFELETALRSHPENEEIFRQERGEGGVHIECPFEDEHTEPGGTGTFIVNASQNDGRGIGLHCCHNSCLTARGDGQRIDRLIFIKRMLELGLLTLHDLQNPEFGGGKISARVYHQSRSTHGRDLRVVDKDRTGADVAAFHANFIAKPDQFDFERLNVMCKTQIAPDITAEQLASFIGEGRVTIANLIECAAPADEKSADDDPYQVRLKELALKKRNGEVRAKDVAEVLKSMKTEFGVNKKDAEADLARLEEASAAGTERFGILSAEETALIEPMRDYRRDFAILNTGGKGVVLNLRQPDLSKALMPRDDFEFLYRKDWIEVGTAEGIETIYPAKRFLAKPPKDAQVYHDGVVFKPAGTVKASEYNLYQGMLIEPDESGSCVLLRELIRDVWARGDEETAQWVLEYLMHIIAYPGDKPGTSIAIRGKPGDGKSFVFEKLLSTILGDMVLRVANQRMVLGDFNEAAIGKLAIVLEEAAFAGDKAAFDRLKEVITGDKVLINPKFKAPIAVDNFARLAVISNHDHFLHIKPDDRRYTVVGVVTRVERNEQV